MHLLSRLIWSPPRRYGSRVEYGCSSGTTTGVAKHIRTLGVWDLLRPCLRPDAELALCRFHVFLRWVHQLNHGSVG